MISIRRFSCNTCHDIFTGVNLVQLHILVCHQDVPEIRSRIKTKYTRRNDRTNGMSGAGYTNTAMTLAGRARTRSLSACEDSMTGKESYIYLVDWQELIQQVASSPLQSIISCFNIRQRLVELLAKLECKEDAASRKALLQDDLKVACTLKDIISTDSGKDELLALRGAAAENVLNIVHLLISENNLWIADIVADFCEDTPSCTDLVTNLLSFRRKLIRLSVRLSQEAGCLPSSVYLSGVHLEQQRITGGACSDIYRGQYKDKTVALKTFRVFQSQTRQQRVKSVKMLYREILLLCYLLHPNISILLGVSQETFEGLRIPCLVSIWMPHGALPAYIEEKKPGRTDRLRLAVEVAEGLAYLHEAMVVHGDLHGNNVLIDENGHARLTDFGLSSFTDSSGGSSLSAFGAMKWMAPEILSPQTFKLEKVKHSCPSDMYSFGCIVWQIFSGTIPLHNMSIQEIIEKVPKGARPLRSSSPQPIPDEVWRIIDECWHNDRARRPSAVSASFGIQVYMSSLLRSLAKQSVRRRPSTSSLSGVRPRTSSFLEPRPRLRVSVRYLACSYPEANYVVPQRAFRPTNIVAQDNLQDHVMFYKDNGAQCGIACVDALQGRFQSLDDCNDPLPVVQEQGTITIHILWPGYLDWSYEFRPRTNTSARPVVTRSTLAQSLARCTQYFLKNAERDPQEMHIRDRWELGADGITLEDLELVGMQNLAEQDWQVHYRLKRRRLRPLA
ncbi:hypothetical protein NM688_g3793 [Phlebia brevispora]|uniref:Uncharacterized protein n=1 Tax=Phlebia brevispora TaxID=194682 RepID=A0ACC1T541_9APHY|nr:hypothetical protein NM688_g3793 [Phlebia brevispora]